MHDGNQEHLTITNRESWREAHPLERVEGASCSYLYDIYPGLLPRGVARSIVSLDGWREIVQRARRHGGLGVDGDRYPAAFTARGRYQGAARDRSALIDRPVHRLSGAVGGLCRTAYRFETVAG